MFYGTLNREEKNNTGFQGVIKIASFDRGETFPTQGTGFYGYKHGFKPLTNLSEVDSFFKRQDGDFGTDKFILGFNGSKDWENIVIEEVVNSYMYAILNGSLEVQVGSILIDKNSLASVIEKIKQFNPESLSIEFYLSLTSKDTNVEVGKFKTEDGQFETIKLHLLLGENFHNKISLIRGTGMKIYNKDRFKAPFRFSGTLIVEGENLNKVFRKMEPPTHDDWEPELYKKNIKYAKKLKKDLYKWLNDMVRKIAPKSEQNSFELPGLESILPSLSQDEELTQEVDLNVRDEKINSIVIVNNSMNSAQKTIKRTKTTPKTKRSPKPTPPRSRETKVRIRSMRAFCYDPDKGLYRVILNPSTSGTIFLEVNLVGESVTEKAIIHAAKNEQSGAAITIEKNILGPIEVSKSATSTLTLLLDNLTRYSLEVSAK